jgi:hypothetical protein
LLPCWNPYDDIGSRGVQGGTAEARDRFFPGDHGTLVTVDHIRQNVLPVLYGDDLPPGTALEQTANIPVLKLTRLRRLRLAVGILGYASIATLAAWLLWAPGAN